MATPADPQAAALLSHVVAQMRQNVEFLVSQNYISSADASNIISRLPSSVHGGPASPRGILSSFSVRKRSVPSPPARANQARALWAYNQGGQDLNDLSFSEGDIIEIVSETNADWWTGRVNGKEGLFPSNHVEKIAANSPAPPYNVQSAVGANHASEKPVYRPFMAAHHGIDQPPPLNGSTNSIGLQQAAGQEEKKAKYGALKNTMAHSAAAGLGAGAGMALGGGLVRKIL